MIEEESDVLLRLVGFAAFLPSLAGSCRLAAAGGLAITLLLGWTSYSRIENLVITLAERSRA